MVRVNNKLYRRILQMFRQNITATKRFLKENEELFKERARNTPNISNGIYKEYELDAFLSAIIESGANDGKKILTGVYDQGLKEAYRKINKDYIITPSNIETLKHLQDYGYDLIKSVGNDQKHIIKQQISTGILEGKNPLDIAPKIAESVNLAPTDSTGRRLKPINRARNIARTETMRALNTGNIEAYKNYNIRQVEIVACTTGKAAARTCTYCLGVNGNIVNVNDVTNLPPFHSMCRCTVAPVILESQKIN